MTGAIGIAVLAERLFSVQSAPENPIGTAFDCP